MIDLNSIASASNTSPESASQQIKSLTGNAAELEDQFLTLLVAQLKNQDPLKPIANTEFITQLATFTSVEKLTSIESLLKSSLQVDEVFISEEIDT